MTDITPVATREPAAPDLKAILARVNAGICHAREGSGKSCRESYGVGSWCSACLGHALIAEIERLRAAPPALEEFCGVCGYLLANHFAPCQATPDAENVLNLVMRLVNEGKKPAAMRVLARHIRPHDDDGKRVVQAAPPALQGPLEKLATTTLVDLEYQEARQWRDKWIDSEPDDPAHTSTLHPQIVAYLVADAEQLRRVAAEVERLQQLPPAALQGPRLRAMSEREATLRSEVAKGWYCSEDSDFAFILSELERLRAAPLPLPALHGLIQEWRDKFEKLPVIAQLCPNSNHQISECRSLSVVDRTAMLLMFGELSARLQGAK